MLLEVCVIKKFFVTMMLAVALVFIGSQAEAREVYVGSYSDGTPVYVLTETIFTTSDEERGGSFGTSGGGCRVRAGRDYLDYRFWTESDGVHYRNSEGYYGRINDGSSPVAKAIFNYIR